MTVFDEQSSSTLRVSETLAGTLLTNLQVEVVHTGAELRILAHTAGLQSYGWDADDRLVGQDLPDLFPELIGSEELLADVALGRTPLFELPMINRSEPGSDERRYFSLVAIPNPETHGHLVLLVQDVTHEGRLDQQVMQQLNEVRLLRARLEAANAELLRLDEEKSAFLRMAAHDLRAPLTVVRGYVEMVVEDTEAASDEEAVEYLNVVLSRTTQMTHLIDNLLDVEKIESGEVSLSLEPVDLGQLVLETAKGFALVAEQKGLRLDCEIPEELPLALADRDRLTQVLNNLVSNALKFTPAGGRIYVRLSRTDAGTHVEVADTGPGISQEDQARLFQRFFRTDDSRQRRIAGTGLGLSIVKAIVEQHGGQVYCVSTLDEGSTFGFTLPTHSE